LAEFAGIRRFFLEFASISTHRPIASLAEFGMREFRKISQNLSQFDDFFAEFVRFWQPLYCFT